MQETVKEFGTHSAVTAELQKGLALTAFDLGANLNSFVFDGFDYIRGHRTPDELESHATRAGCAVLIPFANRVKGGRYAFQGRSFQLPINEVARGNALHGFLTEREWKIKAVYEGSDYLFGEKGASRAPRRGAGVVFSYDFACDTGYPFKFSSEVEYSVSNEGLWVRLTVTNTGKSEMPVTMGTHPYYLVDGKLEDWTLEGKSKGRCKAVDLIPTGELEDVSFSGKIGSRAFDECYLADGDVKLYGKKRGIRIKLNENPYVQIYTPPSRDSIAIEPMTAIGDAFNNGIGLKVLKAKERFEATYEVLPFSP